MKILISVIVILFYSTSFGQNIIIDITNKTEQSQKNPAFDIRIIEPKKDTIDLTKSMSFSLSIEYHGIVNSVYILDYPTETYADINNLDQSFTNEEYLKLPDDEWQKYSVIIPKHEILKSIPLHNRWLFEVKTTSKKIKYSEIYVDSKLIKTLYYKH